MNRAEMAGRWVRSNTPLPVWFSILVVVFAFYVIAHPVEMGKAFLKGWSR